MAEEIYKNEKVKIRLTTKNPTYNQVTKEKQLAKT